VAGVALEHFEVVAFEWKALERRAGRRATRARLKGQLRFEGLVDESKRSSPPRSTTRSARQTASAFATAVR
jgi:hypothetical protein